MRYNHKQPHFKSAKSNISKNFLRLKLFLVRVIRRTLKHKTFHKRIDFSSRRQERPEESKNILKKLKTADIMCRVFVTLFLIMTTIACGTTSTGEEDLPAIPGKIAFSAKDDGGTFQIFTMNADGSNVRQLTDDEFSSSDPAWSPDGQQIAFATAREAPVGSNTLWVMDADGSNQRPLVFHPETGRPMFGNHPAWSPDGTKLAFDQCIDCEAFGRNHEISVADLQTGVIDTLVKHPAKDDFPVWSPEGQRIAFTTNRDFVDADSARFRQDIYVIDKDGKNLKRLTENGNAGRQIWLGDEILFWAQNKLFTLNLTNRTKRKIDIDLPNNTNFRPLDVSVDNQMVLLLTFDPSSASQIRSLQIFDLQTNKITEILSFNALSQADWYDKNNPD